MKQPTLVSQSQKYYRRFYRLVAAAVILMTAVLTGSLLLGDSVRGTLVKRVGERLGVAETVITSGTGFMNETLAQHPMLHHAQGYLLMDGFVSVGQKLLPVYVLGTDADTLMPGDVMVNEPLFDRLDNQEDFVLHLPSHNLVPSGSLFVSKNYATQMRVHVAGLKSVDEGGNLLLKNEQTLPLNVFISRQHLAERMELEGKINLILSDAMLSEEQLAASWTPEMSGLHLKSSVSPTPNYSLTSDGVFISPAVVNQLSTPNAPHSTLYFSYFVNSLVAASDTIPYSFVTAVNEWQGEPLSGHDMILSDYAASRLHVRVGDSILMSYFITKHLKNLSTRSQTLRVKQIVPLSAFMHDSLLMADFPGLSHVAKCTDWDSDLPIDMSRVHKEDEDYWDSYRQTPKAIVSYDAVISDWSNAYGNATAMRFSSKPSLLLSPGDADVQLYHPRAQGLKGATGGVDFAGLFLSLGFFIILAAVLLFQNPLVEMFTQRMAEIQLYRQLGYEAKRIALILFREAFSVMLFAIPWGVILGVAYSCLTLWLLGNVWSGATHTEGFALHVRPLSIVIGILGAVLICAVVLWWVIRRQLRLGTAPSHAPFVLRSHPFLLILSFLLTFVLIVWNFIHLHSMVLFIVCGLLWILTWGILLRHLLSSSRHQTSSFTRIHLTWQSIRASFKQHHLAYWTLALGVFAVFAVGLNRPDFRQAVQATGGYHYYVDCRVPIQYDLNHPAVRRKLSLQSLPDSTRFLGFMRHSLDEASCLNLNQVSTPTVLGIDLAAMERFGLTPNAPHSVNHLPSSCQLYIDEEALIWSLKKSVGDTLLYQNDRGDMVPVVIAGTYPTGIFHGSAIMSSDDFRRLWPKENGVEVLLMQSSRPYEAAELLSMAMGEYGLHLQTVEERIRIFFEVTETYLLIFLTLGGLGLLLGIFSLMIIVRKNLTAQSATIQQYRSMGYSDTLIRQLLLRSNLLVPFYAIIVGATGSVISISANVGGAGLSTLLLALALLVALSILLYFGVKFMIKQFITNHSQI